ncbi:MAG: hypothetical protein CME66_00520 [Halobacteriovoraceae bacterium]|nr:hypothetical protein [Halobacteriovoraceae bacterium]
MKLICIAHRGEAQQFIQALKLKTRNNEFYHNHDLALLITGEGHLEVMTKLPYYIAQYDFQEIINYGIAGALNKKLEIKTLYPIRTSYAYFGNKPIFHSYPVMASTRHLDCISSDKRVLNNEDADQMSAFADLVDRELWAIGKIARQYKLPLRAYKLVSDYANEQTQCFELKNQAKEYSQIMLEHFNQNKNQAQIPAIKKSQQLDLSFHTSFTQTKRLETLQQKLDPQSIAYALEELEKEESFKKLKDKQKANKLISKLEAIVNPLNQKFTHYLENLFLPFKKIGANISYDPKLDQRKLVLKMEINDQKNIENLTKTLKGFQFQDVEKVWQGKIDV